MLSDLLRNGLWVPFFSDQDRCLTGGVLRGSKCGPGSCDLMVQSSGTNNRRATRRNEKKAACMVNRSALISPRGQQKCSDRGGAASAGGESPAALFKLGVSKLAHSWAHLNNSVVTDAGGIPGTRTD